MHALRQEILPPSGVQFCTSLNLTHSTLPTPPNATPRQEFTARVLYNVVVARSNLLRIFEVRQELAPVASTDAREMRPGGVRKGTEAVEGEVEMEGDGFVNIAKLTAQKAPTTVTRFHFVREYSVHGIITGVAGVKILASLQDKLDRLLVSFKDAKIALLEWSDVIHDLVTVSIHTYERAPQLTALDAPLFTATLRVDPLSQCAALSLPQDALAIIPFSQTPNEFGLMEQDAQTQIKDVPYSPSFVLDLPVDVDVNLRNIIDFVFLPGFNRPTIAILFQTQKTSTGRLKEFKDTVKLIIFALDFVTLHYPVITTVHGLPHDCISLLPCASSIGGVIILTSNAVIYVDQSSRRVALPVNGWLSRITDIPLQTDIDPTRNLELEGSYGAFVDDKTLFLVLRDGSVHPIDITIEGKVVSRLTMAPALAQTTIPAGVFKMGGDNLFIASTVAPSVLLKAAKVEEEIQDTEDTEMSGVDVPSAVVDIDDGMESDDEDIYGAAINVDPQPSAAGTVTVPKKTRTVVHLSLCDSLPGHGSIADLTFSTAINGDRLKPVPELVAATGTGRLGGFTLFQRDLPIRVKRRVHAIGGARGMWSLPIRQQVRSGGISYERPVNPYELENDSVIISTDANPSPGLSRISTRSGRNDLSITTRMPGTTVGAAPFFQRTAILHVMTNSIRVLEPDGTERQIIKDADGNIPRPKIRSCHISDPFVIIFREDDSIGLFIAETERGKIRRKDMSPMGDKTSRYLTGCFFSDATGIFNIKGAGVEKNPTTTLQAASSANNQAQWLILVRPPGVMEIWALPKLSLVFSTASLSTLQNVLEDSFELPALSLPQDPPRKPQDLDIEQILFASVGETDPTPHLFVFLRSGQLAIYKILQIYTPSENPLETPPRMSTANVRFVKIVSKAFERSEENSPAASVLAEQKRISRSFIPFVTSPAPGTTYSGVFFTGDTPSWIICTDKGGVHVISSGHAFVHSFTTCSIWESKGDFLLYTDEGPVILDWMPGFNLTGPLPSRSVPRGRSYSDVVYDPSTSLIVAASVLQASFASFDEDDVRVWEPDAPNVSDPLCDCSVLELISPEVWITMDGYEFATNEFITSIASVKLETSSTETGTKEFVAVGTIINRGEDLAAKGATYIFEIVEVVPDPAISSSRWYKLRMRCRDDAKGPVTAVCGFEGYLVSSMGQKIFVRAFDGDERLVGVAFLDVGVYVTSLRSLKNLLLIGDAVKSVMFVAFQEDPYKLVVLSKDVQHVCVTAADFFFAEGEMSIVTADEDGVIRVYEYDPTDPESKNGQHLILRAEFHGQVEYRSSAMIARRPTLETEIPQSKLICGATDGSVSSLTPVDASIAKRLQLLQGQLTRNIQHVAGLNPKALRIVRNDLVSKPLFRGVLDGNLLLHFEALPITRQDEITRQIGTDRAGVLKDWISFATCW